MDGGGSKATVTAGDTEGALVGSKVICCVSAEVTASLFIVDDVVVGFASAIVADPEGDSVSVGFVVGVPASSFASNSVENCATGGSVGVFNIDVVSVAGVGVLGDHGSSTETCREYSIEIVRNVVT